jgi:hypothetical protein
MFRKEHAHILDGQFLRINSRPHTERSHGARSLAHSHTRALDAQCRVRIAITSQTTPGTQRLK